ncbi:MAG: DinB family protein [Ktedonobacterales bacterium]
MPKLTFDTLVAMRSRLTEGETDIETEAQDYSIEELKEGIQLTRGMLQAIADRWTQDQLLARPPFAELEEVTTGEDRWSATEAISHLMATQNWYVLHMGRLLGRREHFDVMPHGLGDHATQDMLQDELSESLKAATSRFLAYIESIPSDADWTLKRSSTFFGELSLRGWVLLAALHDEDHWRQIQRVAAQTSFPPA